MRRSHHGFTLVELVFALAIGASMIAFVTGVMAQYAMRIAKARSIMREQALHESASRELSDWLQRAQSVGIYANFTDFEAGQMAVAGNVLTITTLVTTTPETITLEFQAPADIPADAVIGDRLPTGAGRILLHRGGEVSTWLDVVTAETVFDFTQSLVRARWEQVGTRTSKGLRQLERSRWRVVGAPLRMR